MTRFGTRFTPQAWQCNTIPAEDLDALLMDLRAQYVPKTLHDEVLTQLRMTQHQLKTAEDALARHIWNEYATSELIIVCQQMGMHTSAVMLASREYMVNWLLANEAHKRRPIQRELPHATFRRDTDRQPSPIGAIPPTSHFHPFAFE